MSVRLDRDRYYAIVYGDPEKSALQDGMFFDSLGVAVEGSEVAPKPEIRPAREPVQVVERIKTNTAQLEALKGMHISKLKKFAAQVHEHTGIALPEGGKGVKARLVTYIADNTTE